MFGEQGKERNFFRLLKGRMINSLRRGNEGCCFRLARGTGGLKLETLLFERGFLEFELRNFTEIDKLHLKFDDRNFLNFRWERGWVILLK